MLDKSVPYHEILMRRPVGLSLSVPPLPEGYAIALYKPGEEKDWAQIETSVLEFDDEIDALLFFQKRFLPHRAELERRCLFLSDPEGKKIGTVTAWWDYIDRRRVPWLHWLSLRPGFQGMGLGRALLAHCLQLFADIEGDQEIYLSTQTWSHVAVNLYQEMGFAILHAPMLGQRENKEVDAAIAVLSSLEKQRNRKND